MYRSVQNQILCFAVLFLSATTVWAAKFKINYLDGGNFGFNAATARDPVGGNDGTTLGQQRKNILQKATEIWGQYLESDVEIEILAQFESGGGDKFGATLASGGPLSFYKDFTNQPKPNTWYAIALANSLAESDLEAGEADMYISINESVDSDSDVLGGHGFYYGYDGNTGLQVNLLTTLLHEIGHGLGFISSINPVDGKFELKSSDQQPGEPSFPDSFSLLLKDTKTGKLWNDMTDAERKQAVANNPAIVFDGAYTNQASRQILRYRINPSSPFFEDDFIDFKSLVLKLKNRTGPVSQFLRDQFDTSAQSLLNAYNESQEPSETLKNAVVKELNWVLKGDSIYGATRFDGINLSPKTKQLLEQNPQGEDLIFLNRLLLEDAYPEEIEKIQINDEGGILLTINGSESFSESFQGAAPEFGPGIPSWGLSGQIVLVNDGTGKSTSDACEGNFVNADEIRGRIALIDRGDCFFVDKVKRAQDAGAVAAVITNNVEDGVLNMGLGEVYIDIAIPSVFISKADGDLIKAALVDEKLYVSVSNQREFSGTQNNLINVDPLSISHWTPDAFPNLLMEPEISGPTRTDLDLTLTALRDIGWKISNIPFTYLSFELWANEQISGAGNGLDDDPDADGSVNLMEYAFGTDPEDAASIPSSVKFLPSGDGGNLFTLKYKRSPAPADIIFSVNKTNSLKAPFTETIGGSECRQFNRFVDEDGLENMEFQIESAATQQFFNVEVRIYSQ